MQTIDRENYDDKAQIHQILRNFPCQTYATYGNYKLLENLSMYTLVIIKASN